MNSLNQRDENGGINGETSRNKTAIGIAMFKLNAQEVIEDDEDNEDGKKKREENGRKELLQRESQ